MNILLTNHFLPRRTGHSGKQNFSFNGLTFKIGLLEYLKKEKSYFMEDGMRRSLIIAAAIGLIFAWLVLAQAQSKIVARPVEYSAQGLVLKGYLAYDEAVQGKRPGLLVVHEWWGHNEYARTRARMLAGMGYTALAVDMYGDGKQAGHPEEAGKFAAEVSKNFEAGKARFIAAMEFLKQQPSVDPSRIAAIGYCFGGGVVLNMARQGLDLKGVASFHGSLPPVRPAQPGGIKAKILVLNGADDKMVTAEQIEAFKQEMKDAGADYQFISYPGARHSFTNPEADALAKKFNLPLAYNADADKKSWAELAQFLKKVFSR
jgi:dienelactone hydrolase